MIIKLVGQYRDESNHINSEKSLYMQVIFGGKWHIQMCKANGNFYKSAICSEVYPCCSSGTANRTIEQINQNDICKKCKKIYEDTIKKHKNAIQVKCNTNKISSIDNLEIKEANKVKISVQLDTTHNACININGKVNVSAANKIIKILIEEILEIPEIWNPINPRDLLIK